jgi:hypothetical protein
MVGQAPPYMPAELVDELGRLHIYNYQDIYGKLVDFLGGCGYFIA